MGEVPLALRELSALVIYCHAMRYHLAIGSLAFGRHPNGERRVEPSAMLVVPFKIDIRRVSQFLPAFQDGAAGGAGIEPDIQNVLFLAEFAPAASGALEPFRQQLCR